MKKITIIIIVLIIGIYIFVKNPYVQAPAIQDQTQTQGSPRADSVSSGMEGMSSEQMMGHEQSSANKAAGYTINYTDKGFSPSSLEIKAGETVQFINNSSGGMWVASGPHPTHTGYPGFDAKNAILKGESYEFTFTKVGAWSYHNHAGPEKSGMIIVK